MGSRRWWAARGRVPPVRVLLSEGSSLTAREFVTCLGPLGYWLEVLDPDPLCLARWSRWVRRVHRCPAAGVDPVRYLEFVRRVVAERSIDVVLPTHEQAWLFAAAGGSGASGVPVGVASAEAFGRVQSKIEFARLLDELGVAQPAWRLVVGEDDLIGLPFPYWLKAAFSTAGQGVRLVRDASSRDLALRDLLRVGAPVMAQLPAVGRYGQVQGLFSDGRLVAVHTSVQTGVGLGGSAAARLSVDHPVARRDLAAVGSALGWEGGLTLDYMHVDGVPQYIECNPRTVEPANATASGVNIPDLQVRLTQGEALSSPARVGRPGVRTHGTIALLLGVAERSGERQAVLRELGRLMSRRGPYRSSREVLTSVVRDPPSAVALAVVVGRVLASPRQAGRVAAEAVERYSVRAETIQLLRAGGIGGE